MLQFIIKRISSWPQRNNHFNIYSIEMNVIYLTTSRNEYNNCFICLRYTWRWICLKFRIWIDVSEENIKTSLDLLPKVDEIWSLRMLSFVVDKVYLFCLSYYFTEFYLTFDWATSKQNIDHKEKKEEKWQWNWQKINRNSWVLI